jgi:RimJ/RimL family protein N-acetyltransferase
MGELVYRRAELADAALAADLMTAAYPALPEDPIITRYRWERPRRDWSFERFIAEMDGRPVAFLDWLHGPPEQDPERHCEVSVYLDAAELDVGLLTSMWQWVAGQAEAAGSRVLEGYCAEDEPEMLAALARAGFEQDRREKVWELDLKEHGDRLVREARDVRAKVSEGGITLLTVADWRDPEAFNKLHVLDGATRKDMPSTFPNLPETFADFTQRVNSPDRPHDRWWIALDGDRPVAMSYLKFPPVRGPVWTGYTASDREYRGRGLARAVKLQTLAQAAELGIAAVQTDNDSENAPMLHINEKLGYRSRPGFVSHLKRVGSTHDA